MSPMRILLLCVLGALSCCAETRFYVDQRGDWANGKSFGSAGIYEFITARVVTDAGEGRAEVLKPREPKLGSGVLVVEVNGKGKLGAPDAALEAGQTIVRLAWRDAGTVAMGVSQIVNFLRYTGGPMLLGDQSRFLKKKAVLVDNGPWVAQFVASDRNKDAKGRVLVDETVSAIGK